MFQTIKSLTSKKLDTLELLKNGTSIDLARRLAGFSRQQLELCRRCDEQFDMDITVFTRRAIYNKTRLYEVRDANTD